uniref:ribosomal protein L6 n=1 Tax=Sargassum phyllocystum TaxID=1219119 RepID=UPI0020286ABE|nr:ribosomal protein L6 [Sargassum phyllocystum]YP_010401968.1 ribosomal protein L6 [Sargassum mcclurei]UQV81069.1 ribosomal protein L6 [Sargassum phyllocystum]UQV81143.1 ribosomal protein L6 [Sargassum mcclurei]
MIAPVYRLPLGVNCLSNNGKVYISGPCGVVYFDCVSKIYRKGNMVVFLPYLAPYCSSIFTQAVLGVVLGYSIELILKGVGYKVYKSKEKLIFTLGFSHSISIDIPEGVSVRFNKKTLSFMSANFGLLQNFTTSIRAYRFPDSYKGAGVVYVNEIVTCKEGKKN